MAAVVLWKEEEVTGTLVKNELENPVRWVEDGGIVRKPHSVSRLWVGWMEDSGCSLRYGLFPGLFGCTRLVDTPL